MFFFGKRQIFFRASRSVIIVSEISDKKEEHYALLINGTLNRQEPFVRLYRFGFCHSVYFNGFSEELFLSVMHCGPFQSECIMSVGP